jgi:hypothetical protein
MPSKKKGGNNNNDGAKGKRPASSNNNSSGAASKKNKKSHQITLVGAGMKKVDKAPLLTGQSALFTDAIYGKAIPPEHKGKYFLYYVRSYDAETEEFTVKYRNSMIMGDGLKWINQDGGRAEMGRVKLKTIEEGIELYSKAIGRIAEHEKEEAAVAEGNLKKRATKLTPEEVDTTDLDEASVVNVDKGWSAQVVMEVSALPYYISIYIFILILTLLFVSIFFSLLCYTRFFLN